MVCAPKQVELAMRPQNLPGIQKLFGPWSYFIDTTYAVGPAGVRRSQAPPRPQRRHRLEDQAQRQGAARCSASSAASAGGNGPCRTAISSRAWWASRAATSTTLKPESLGARVIPFWEMVYHDCQICYGKYGYGPEQAGEYVAHHVLAARPLNYHSIPDHLYWTRPPKARRPSGPSACFTRTRRRLGRGARTPPMPS